MRLGNLVLRMRRKNTTFGTMIGGAAELAIATMKTLTKDMAFIIPLLDSAEPNNYDSQVDQKIVERFGVTIALATDEDMQDKLGHKAYSKIHDIRNELFSVFVGVQLPEAESLIYYRGGRLVDFNSAYLWWQFEFEYVSRMSTIKKFDNGKTEYGIDDIDVDDEQEPTDFNEIRTYIIQAPSIELPYTGVLPNNNLPSWSVDFRNNPAFGAFAKAFFSGFNVNKI